MKVLLVYPNTSFVMTPQMGLLALGSFLLHRGMEARICDLSFTPINRFGDQLLSDIQNWNPDVVALSCRTMEWKTVTSLCREIKLRYPKKTVIVGGPHVTFRPESIVPFADFGIRGEGELALFEVVKAIADGFTKDIKDIPNVTVVKGAEIVKNPLRPLMDLSTQPIPVWSLFDERHYTNHCCLAIKPGTKVCGTFEGSRGCLFDCTYCSNKNMMDLYRGLGVWRREKPAAQIRAEIDDFKSRYDNDLIYFIDEVIMTSDKRTRDLREELHDVRIPFVFMDRPELINEERVVNLAQAGAYSCSIGIESADERYRKEYLKRNMKDETIVNAYQTVKRHGILTHSFILLGLPGQTRKIMRDTYELLKQLQPDSAQATTFFPLPGTQLEQYCKDHGLMPELETPPSSYYGRSLLKYDNEWKDSISTYTNLINVGAWRKSKYGSSMEKIGLFFPSMLPLIKKVSSLWRVLQAEGCQRALQKIYHSYAG